jgi:hypothetical protein
MRPLSWAISRKASRVVPAEQPAAPPRRVSVRADAPQTAAISPKSIPQVSNSRGLYTLARPMDDFCPPFCVVTRERPAIVHPSEPHPCHDATPAGPV